MADDMGSGADMAGDVAIDMANDGKYMSHSILLDRPESHLYDYPVTVQRLMAPK